MPLAFFSPLSRFTRRDIPATHLSSLVFLLEINCQDASVGFNSARSLSGFLYFIF
jgi:hypothetical protein